MEFRTVIEKEFLFQAVNNGTFSVDTFFFIRYKKNIVCFKITFLSSLKKKNFRPTKKFKVKLKFLVKLCFLNVILTS